MELDLPARYEPLAQLGKGGGGEVWAVRDRHTGQRFALKVLDAAASSREMAALVREAVSLSGLEGLGVPRVVRFGRLPGSGRPFLVRELVEGSSLEQLMSDGAAVDVVLSALCRAADQLTVLHRAGLFHGDVKPANVIVDGNGSVTFVDLGLAAPFREGGVRAEGLTPRYAAPELFEGKPLTVRAEVYALGVALAEALNGLRPGALSAATAKELLAISERAIASDPSERYPSVDELASAIRRAAGLAPVSEPSPEQPILWPIVGIDAVSSQLLEAAGRLEPGAVLRLEGLPGSGRSALLRRLAWSLGIHGRPLAWIDDAANGSALRSELSLIASEKDAVVLVDDADALDDTGRAELEKAREAGARLVLVGGAWLSNAVEFRIPPLDDHAAADLVRRAVPSLTPSLQKRVVRVAGGRPGELRRLVRLIASQPVASAADIERALGSADASGSVPESPLDLALYHLDRGRFVDAKAALDRADAARDPVRAAVLRARLELGLGEAGAALARLGALGPELERASEADRALVRLYEARARIGTGEYRRAIDDLEPLAAGTDAVAVEALAYQGLALSLIGQHEAARSKLELGLERAGDGSPRVLAVVLACFGLVLQRADAIDEARDVYRRAIDAAERAGDAGTLATVQLNLAGLCKIRGDIAEAIEHFEAAVDMGRRSGRRLSARQALLNLANTDLYLGRLSRARASIDALEQQRAQLPPEMRAQLLGLRAEHSARQGQLEQAGRLYDECAAAFEALGRGRDAAEARLEGVLVAARGPHPDLAELRRRVALAETELADTSMHRPLSLLAQARVAALGGDEVGARQKLDEALAAARAAAQKEWIWRAFEARAELAEAGGQPLLARRDREEALAVLEEIGARLPRDLREVYWNDPRRRFLRGAVHGVLGTQPTEFLPFGGSAASAHTAHPTRTGPTWIGSGSTSISQLAGTTLLEQRLAWILDVNSDLVGEYDLERLTAKVTDHAVELARAERGFVLLRQEDGTLSIHTSRSRVGDAAHGDFSRSIAETVIETREPVVAVDAKDDARLQSFASVHQMMLKSVACVPILAPRGRAIGALYLETRLRQARHFERELSTLRAFADQVAIALENARLINENRRRADELAAANAQLEEAQRRLKELLEGRTEQLKRARQKLRDAREALFGHFGYHGLVGTSAAMRRVYALIDRVKDTDVPVLITGESGTGKEMVARAIHGASARSKAKILGVNCGAIPENLLESELFGHVKGAFTGADRDRKGLFRECEGGSILLDEIGEMPTKMQAGLLRVLQERKVRPVGGTHEEPVDVRILFATNRDLVQMIGEGKFREDLYYRINVVEIRLPSLRERAEDIPQLVDHFLGIFAARYKREKKSVTRDGLRRLADFDWPGNVRQLEHVLLNAWVMSEESELDAADFDMPDGWQIDKREQSSVVASAAPQKARAARKGTISQHRRDERERILECLKRCNWNRVKAAELSGIPRRTFYRRLREYGIQ